MKLLFEQAEPETLHFLQGARDGADAAGLCTTLCVLRVCPPLPSSPQGSPSAWPTNAPPASNPRLCHVGATSRPAYFSENGIRFKIQFVICSSHISASFLTLELPFVPAATPPSLRLPECLPPRGFFKQAHSSCSSVILFLVPHFSLQSDVSPSAPSPSCVSTIINSTPPSRQLAPGN